MQEKKELLKPGTEDLDRTIVYPPAPPNTPVNSDVQPKTRGPLLITPDQMSLYMNPTFFKVKSNALDELDSLDLDTTNGEQPSF